MRMYWPASPGNCINAGFNWLSFTNAFDTVNHNPVRWISRLQVVIWGATYIYTLVLFQIKHESLTKRYLNCSSSEFVPFLDLKIVVNASLHVLTAGWLVNMAVCQSSLSCLQLVESAAAYMSPVRHYKEKQYLLTFSYYRALFETVKD